MYLKEIRQSKGLSVAALSQLSGVSLRTIQDLEKRGDGRISTLRKLTNAMGISLDDLFVEPHS